MYNEFDDCLIYGPRVLGRKAMEFVMKKKILIVLGAVTMAALIAAGVVVVKFWPIISALDPSLITMSNIKAAYMALTMDDQTKDERLQELDNGLSEDIKSYVNTQIRDFTEEEKQQIESGEKSKTEIIAQIITESVNGENVPEKDDDKIDNNVDSDNNKKQENSQVADKNQTEQQKKDTSDEIVAKHIATLYQYHSEFEGRVAALKERARAYMNAYKKAHPDITWRDAKIATMNNLMSEATRIENECYAKVDAEIAALEKELKSIGADTSVVSTVKTAAYNEMEVRKSKIAAEGRAELSS